MAEGQGGDRTEAPTARRLQQAREEGRVALSREVVSLASLLAGGAALAAAWHGGGVDLAIALRDTLATAGSAPLDQAGLAGVLSALARPALRFAAPVVLASLVAVLAASLLQTGLVFRTASLLPDLTRLHPARGLSRLFGPTNAVEAVKSLVKLGCFALAIAHVLRSDLPQLPGLAGVAIPAFAGHLCGTLLHAAGLILAVQFVIAGIDLLWVRHRHTSALRMSKQDLRDEHKESEGNPHVKARLRSLRRQRARQRMMQAVPKAAVVLTNPTHYAVALAYEQGSRSAPRVVAKGADEVAFRIRALAKEHRVPIVENKPLARALFSIPLDAEIPREHFQAVAAVIAYVWRLAAKRHPQGGPFPAAQRLPERAGIAGPTLR